jgi:hypothetical protein
LSEGSRNEKRKRQKKSHQREQAESRETGYH